MNIERVERIPDLVRDAGSKQSERVEPLRFERLLRASPALGDVAQDDRVTDALPRDVHPLLAMAVGVVLVRTYLTLDHQRHDVEINETIRWIKNLHVPAHRAFTARKRFPIKPTNALIQALA